MSKTQASIEKTIVTNSNPDNEDDKIGHLSIIDSFGRLPIASMVGFMRYVDKRTREDLIEEVHAIKWKQPSSIYTSKLPGRLLPNLEVTQKSYRTELAIEGKQISPDWYLLTITAQQYLFHLKKYYDYTKSISHDFYQVQVRELIKNHKILQAAHLTDRWIEYTNKSLTLGWDVQHLIAECENLNKVQDLPWAIMDSEAEKQLLQSSSQQAIDMLVFLMPYLSVLPESELKDLPDYFGQAYTFGVEACYQAARDNQTERLARLFPLIYLGALSSYQSARKEVEGWSEQSKIIFTSEPLEDILTLSGFIKIYSELYENPELWKICEDTWNKYLDESDAKSTIELFVAMSQYRDGQFTLMPKAALRLNWDRNFGQKLVELGLQTDISANAFSGTAATINHSSALIRILARRPDALSVDARNIFYVIYMSKHPSIQGLDLQFPDRRDLERQLNQEEEAQGEDNEE